MLIIGSDPPTDDKTRPGDATLLSSEKIFAAAERLPPFPGVIWKVMSLVRQMAPVREIEEVIKYDQAIAAKVLTMCHSPFYAQRCAIGSLRDAIVVLGDEKLIQIVMTACSARYFEPEISGYELREGEIWQHAVATALIAEKVAARLGKDKVFASYTAGLLHDIGKAVLSFQVKSYMDAILFQMAKKGLPFLDAERVTLGVDHQELGEMLARRWGFPPEVVIGIGYHHRPKEAESHKDVAAAVYVANRIATALGFSCVLQTLASSYEDDIFKILGIKIDMVEGFWSDVASGKQEIEQLIGELPHSEI